MSVRLHDRAIQWLAEEPCMVVDCWSSAGPIWHHHEYSSTGAGVASTRVHTHTCVEPHIDYVLHETSHGFASPQHSPLQSILAYLIVPTNLHYLRYTSIAQYIHLQLEQNPYWRLHDTDIRRSIRLCSVSERGLQRG